MDDLANDIIWGAVDIGAYTNRKPRQVYRGKLPIFRIGNMVCARKSTLRAYIVEQERIALEKAAADRRALEDDDKAA